MQESTRSEMSSVNIAKIMIPKAVTAFLHTDDTVRKGLEIMRHHGYTAIPVLDENDSYVGCISEGDFLRHVFAVGTTDMKAHEDYLIGSIVRPDFCPSLQITAAIGQVISSVQGQNFVPIVDGRNCFCGIVTRRAVISLLYDIIEGRDELRCP